MNADIFHANARVKTPFFKITSGKKSSEIGQLFKYLSKRKYSLSHAEFSVRIPDQKLRLSKPHRERKSHTNDTYLSTF